VIEMARKIKRSGAGWEVGGVWFSFFNMAEFASTRPALLKTMRKYSNKK
jgi:hypothetical protein